MDILAAYISAIQALRVLDPSCVILEKATEPVKQYLRYYNLTLTPLATGASLMKSKLVWNILDVSAVTRHRVCTIGP